MTEESELLEWIERHPLRAPHALAAPSYAQPAPRADLVEALRSSVAKMVCRGYDSGVELVSRNAVLGLVDEAIAALSEAPREAEGWRRQPWMGPNEPERWLTHDEAMKLIHDAASVCVLRYEESVMIYTRARGFIVDDAESLGEPFLPAAPKEPGE